MQTQAQAETAARQMKAARPSVGPPASIVVEHAVIGGRALPGGSHADDC